MSGIGKHGDQEKEEGVGVEFPHCFAEAFPLASIHSGPIFYHHTGWNVRALLVSQWRKLEASDLGREMGGTAEKEQACVGSHIELSILQDKP